MGLFSQVRLDLNLFQTVRVLPGVRGGLIKRPSCETNKVSERAEAESAGRQRWAESPFLRLVTEAKAQKL